MELHECILTRNDCCRRGTPLVPRGVMVHSTGANNPYLRRYVQPDDGELGKNRYDNDWNRPGLPVCVHAFLGKKAGGGIAVYQTLPWEVQAWHCGRSGNRTHLAFEICEDGLDDRAYFTAVYREAVELTAYLCRRFGLDPLADGVVLDHAEGNRRGIGQCPRRRGALVPAVWEDHGRFSAGDGRAAAQAGGKGGGGFDTAGA